MENYPRRWNIVKFLGDRCERENWMLYLFGKLCFAMGLYTTNVIRRIQSFVKICYIGLLRVIYAVLSNDRERERENLNIFEHVINGAKVFYVYLYSTFTCSTCGQSTIAGPNCQTRVTHLNRAFSPYCLRVIHVEKGRREVEIELFTMSHHSSIIPIRYSYLFNRYSNSKWHRNREWNTIYMNDG